MEEEWVPHGQRRTVKLPKEVVKLSKQENSFCPIQSVTEIPVNTLRLYLLTDKCVSYIRSSDSAVLLVLIHNFCKARFNFVVMQNSSARSHILYLLYLYSNDKYLLLDSGLSEVTAEFFSS